MDDARTKAGYPTQWCLVGNIVKTRPYGPGGEHRPGTLHFSGGTKVWCLPAQWGDGYDQIFVIGRHRGSKKFVTMVVSSIWVENWRAQVVYNPEVLRRINECPNTIDNFNLRNWISEGEVRQYLAMISTRIKADS